MSKYLITLEVEDDESYINLFHNETRDLILNENYTMIHAEEIEEMSK